MKKVLLGMSGGVDSSVAAVILAEQGLAVSGVTLLLCDKGGTELTDVADAKAVCDRLSVPHYVFDFMDKFKKEVIDRFVNQYKSGLTPNPCIECNKYIKFNQMLDEAEKLGQDFIATGHYARREFDSASGRYLLKRAADINKDQSYVLYDLTQSQLEKVLFPLGDLTKPQVREIAQKYGFVSANRPDSQDICFIPDGDYAKFIEKYTDEKQVKGNYLDVNGKILGQHQGAIKYTLGQRKGLGIALGKPQFVISKSMENNTVTLGDEELLFKKNAIITDCNFVTFDKLESSMRITAKARYRQKDSAATIHPLSETEVLLEFDSPQRAMTPGQSAVFYDGDVVIGGGKIKE